MSKGQPCTVGVLAAQDYARESAEELGIEVCFTAFLPKPQIMIDDVEISKWRSLKDIHPNSCDSYSLEDYRKLLALS